MVSPTLDRYTYITRGSNSSSGFGHVVNGKFREDAKIRGDYSYYSYNTSLWNVFGYIPVIRTISGTLRASLGVIDVIMGLALNIFTQKQEYLNIAYNGFENVIRGCFEVAGDAIIVMSFVTRINFIAFSPLPEFFGFVGAGLALAAYDDTKDPKQTVIYEP